MAFVGFAQDSWKELEAYHTVMSQTFHPAEEGNFEPLMSRSGELAKAALELKTSPMPAAYAAKPEIKKLISKLAKESASVNKLVVKKASQDEIKTAMFALHDRFHQIVEACEE